MLISQPVHGLLSMMVTKLFTPHLQFLLLLNPSGDSLKAGHKANIESNGTDSFQKLVSETPVNLSRLSFFGNLKIPKNFLFHLAFLLGMNWPQFR